MKTPLTTLPSDAFVVAALDELIGDTQSLLDATLLQKPRDRTEATYWRSQRNAYVNAQKDYLDGSRPTPTPTGYLFASSSRPGALTHRCWQAGGVWACSCEAGERGLFHRHTALISALERAAELESLAAARIDPVTEAAAVLAARLAETAQILDDLRAGKEIGRRIAEARASYLRAA